MLALGCVGGYRWRCVPRSGVDEVKEEQVQVDFVSLGRDVGFSVPPTRPNVLDTFEAWCLDSRSLTYSEYMDLPTEAERDRALFVNPRPRPPDSEAR